MRTQKVEIDLTKIDAMKTHFYIARTSDKVTRLVGRDADGWHFTNDLLYFSFETREEAEKTIDALVFHGHARECFKVKKRTSMLRIKQAQRDVLMQENPDQIRGCS